MSEKFLYLLATFDEKTTKLIKEIENIITKTGIVGNQTPNLPPHITLGSFNINQEDEILQLLQCISTKTNSFDLDFNHIGLFGLKVMFLAPDVNYQLLDLHKKFEQHCIRSSRGWTPHATLLIDEAENIQKALPLIAENFRPIKARVESISLYEFFPTRFIAKYNFQ